MKGKILDILIPTYKYKKGLKLNLNFFADCYQKKNINVIISDNSPVKMLTNSEIDLWAKKFNNNFFYQHIHPIKNPISNWNNLIEKSVSDYFLLLHQDEHFCCVEELNNLIVYLSKNSKNKKLHITKHNAYLKLFNKEVNSLLPYSISEKLVKYYTKILFGYNLIGPPSCLIVPYNKIKYDPNFKMLVDVEYYYRIFQNYDFKYFNIKTYTSISNLTITKSLGDKKRIQIKNELKFLKKENRLNNCDTFIIYTLTFILKIIKAFSILIRLYAK